MVSMFMGHTMTASSAYYRMIGFGKKMQRQGHKIYWNEWDAVKFNNATNNYFEKALTDPELMKEVANEFEFLHKVKKVDAWVFQLLGSTWGLALQDLIQKHWQRPFITEIDDYFEHVNENTVCSAYYAPGTVGKGIARQQVEDSSLVIVSTEQLKTKLSHLNKNIQVVPNGVDFGLWKQQPKTSDRIIIGHEGGYGHGADISIIKNVVLEILKKYDNVEFQFVGDPSVPSEWRDHPRIIVQPMWLPVTKYPEAKAKLNWDIELAPLVDSEFNRCKSNLRWLEASALRTPVVASNVIPYRNTNALLCKGEKEWFQVLSKLTEDQQLRIDKGREGYKLARAKYSLPLIASKYAKVVEDECERVKEVLKKLEVKGLKICQE